MMAWTWRSCLVAAQRHVVHGAALFAKRVSRWRGEPVARKKKKKKRPAACRSTMSHSN